MSRRPQTHELGYGPVMRQCSRLYCEKSWRLPRHLETNGPPEQGCKAYKYSYISSISKLTLTVNGKIRMLTLSVKKKPAD